MKYDLEPFKNKCGVYSILLTTSGYRYIGSSCKIANRLWSHIHSLEHGRHHNSKFQSLWDGKYEISILEECEEKDLLIREKYYISKYNKCVSQFAYCDHSVNFEQELYDKIKSKIKYENECWIYTGNTKEGYGRIRSNGKTVMVHRVMYYFFNHEYPFLIRHLCNNRACCNPDHLKKGSCRDNALDKNKEFRTKFLDTYNKYHGDLTKISESLDISRSRCYYYRKHYLPHINYKEIPIVAFGESRIAKDWLLHPKCAKGLDTGLIRNRIRSGWSPEKAISIPKQSFTAKTIHSLNIYRGWYLYGYPLSLIPIHLRDQVVLQHNEYSIPDEPDKFTYWISSDNRRNIHFRQNKYYYVINGNISGPYDNYLSCLQAMVSVSEDVEAKQELEKYSENLGHRF